MNALYGNDYSIILNATVRMHVSEMLNWNVIATDALPVSHPSILSE